LLIFFQAIWPYSGHYLPTEENFREFIRYLEENNVDLTNVKVNVRRFYSFFYETYFTLFYMYFDLRNCIYMFFYCLIQKSPIDKQDEYPLLSKPDAQPNAAASDNSDHNTKTAAADEQLSEPEVDGDSHLTTGDGNMSEAEEDDTDTHPDSSEEVHSSRQQQQEEPTTPVSGGADQGKNHQTRRWSTGTGPRIRCVRDYPQDLQSRALEHVNLSPRLAGSPSRKRDPVPFPRPGPAMILSPRLASVGFQPQTTVSLKLPDLKRSRLQ
jgi:hypothetical protein